MSRFLDIMSLVQIPIGFLIGLAILLILDLFGFGFWASLAVLAFAVPLYYFWDYIMGRLMALDPFEWLFPGSRPKGSARQEARDRKIGRIAFPLGMVLAFIAAQIWPPLEISKALF